MRTTTLALTAVAALGFSVAQASAATLLLDGFGTNQSVSDPNGTASSTVMGGDILGGTRTLTVENNTGGAPNATALDVFGGNLSFSNKASSTGTGTIDYNGGGAGLGDIVLGANPFFLFDVVSFDNFANVDITVNGTDADGSTITYTENVQSGFDPKLLFSAFTDVDAGGIAGFDFTNVASLQFVVSTLGLGEDIDGAISSISIGAVPLPASSLLLLGGLGGLMTMRRRKNKA